MLVLYLIFWNVSNSDPLSIATNRAIKASFYIIFTSGFFYCFRVHVGRGLWYHAYKNS